jgi:dolichyl-phosphate-mannose--protein O-mannosyl transferase
MTTETKPTSLLNWNNGLFLGFVILLSFFTYFHNYSYPKAVFWDENYHIASAQKYLHGVYFMEQHPPLGKLLVAMGEKMIHANPRSDQFLGTDYATNFDANFSFAGYRFFSAFLGWWTAALIFLIFLLILRQPVFATLLSFLYIFDNAIIVHVRGAMLEGPLLFFSASMILAYFLIRYFHDRPKVLLWSSIFFGAAFGCVMTTKLLGLVLILLVPFVLWTLRKNRKQLLKFILAAGLSFLFVYIGVWQIHFSLGRTINPQLPDNGYYQASESYKRILTMGLQNSPAAFPAMIRDSWHFVSHYNAGTPRLDLCKTDENGSTYYMWPIGARSINYRWETPDGQLYRYLYLQSNPVVWIGTFVIILVAAGLFIASFLIQGAQKLRYGFDLGAFLLLYVGFFGGISRITRVLYLYHYFLALLFGFVIVCLFFAELQRVGKWTLNESRKLTMLVILAMMIFAGFQFYRPFTYYEPLTKEQVQRRAIIKLWDLSCVGCERTDGLAIPTKN